jgi:hypothetical protein
MANIDPLLERNKHFATTTAREGLITTVIPAVPMHASTSRPAATSA